MSLKTFYYCGIPIEYSLTRKPVKNLNIRINEKGEILVSARKGIAVNEINSFVEGKAEWIIRSLAAVERYNQMKPDSELYVGKKVFFLGQMYTVDVVESETDYVQEPQEDSGVLTICAKEEDSGYLKEIYLKWLKEQAETVFGESLKKMHKRVKKEGIPYPEFSIRNMKSRWGSCSPAQKSITLNLQLIKTDRECIDQVVLHELCHFKEGGHNEKFYGLLDKYMSDWRTAKGRLEEKYKDGI